MVLNRYRTSVHMCYVVIQSGSVHMEGIARYFALSRCPILSSLFDHNGAVALE